MTNQAIAASNSQLCSQPVSSQQSLSVCEPAIGEHDVAYVNEALRNGWIGSAGKYIDAFEERWATYCGRRFGVAVSSGTAALHAAVAALDLAPDDEVIMPTFTIMSCAQSVAYNGARPVLVDCDEKTWCMNVEDVSSRISRRTRAIMPVHIYGHPVDMDAIMRLADEYGLAVIEDAAEAHGAEYLSGHGSSWATWQRCGGMGTLSTFSFYANKVITTGEGGMVLTDDEDLAERVRSLRNLCFGSGDQRFRHLALGHNFRMTNIQAALGVGQLERIDEIVEKKRWIGRTYREHLAGIAGLQLPAEESWARSVYWMYGVVIDEKTRMTGATFTDQLRRRGVDTRPFFLGMHEQPVFKDRDWFSGEHYPVAEHLARQGCYLPSGLQLSESDIDRVARAISDVIGKASSVQGG